MATGGLASGLVAASAISSTGTVLSGFLNVAGGTTGSKELGDAATAVSVAINPIAIVYVVATGDMDTADLLGGVSDQLMSTINLLKLTSNGSMLSSALDFHQVVSAPISTAINNLFSISQPASAPQQESGAGSPHYSPDDPGQGDDDQ